MEAKFVNLRRWDILFYFSYDTNDKDRILDALVWADAPDSVISQVSDSISAGVLNNGFCFSNPEYRISVVGIGKTTTGPQFLNTAIHEIVHVAQHIAGAKGIDPLSEDFAYLVGDISQDISPVICEMSCPHCRHE